MNRENELVLETEANAVAEDESTKLNNDAFERNLSATGVHLVGFTDAKLHQASMATQEGDLDLSTEANILEKFGINIHRNAVNDPDFWDESKDASAEAFLKSKHAA